MNEVCTPSCQVRGYALPASIEGKLLSESAETKLGDAVAAATEEVQPLIESRSYAEALGVLAKLRPTVDGFFDEVMVMVDDEAIRDNRLRLLASLRSLFLKVADISRLAIK